VAVGVGFNRLGIPLDRFTKVLLGEKLVSLGLKLVSFWEKKKKLKKQL
jgi:hypothetical protein